MNYLNLLANDNISEYRKEREDSRKGRFAVDNKERDMVDFQAISEISDASAAGVGMGYYDDFVSAVDEFLLILVSVCGWLREYKPTLDNW